jgi:hypothetical protein
MAETTTSRPRSSICLVVCFIGTLPPYFNCVLRSCEANPDIDWLILTDDTTPRRLPSNVRLEPATLEGLRKKFSAKLGFEPNLSHYRLLCHFKVAYGFLLQDLLAKYDFWGHCDLDMIFGDLRKFLREDILRAYPKILCRGHLCLYRNTSEVNRYFMLEAPGVISYREVFQGGRIDLLDFDEWRGVYLILRYHNIPQYHDEFIVDVAMPTRWKFTRFEGTAIRNHPEQVFYWHKGKVFQAYYNCDRGINDDEYAYIHFQKRSLPGPGFDPFAVNGFFITPDGFFPYNKEPITDADFARYNRARWRPMNQILRTVRRGLARRLGLTPREGVPASQLNQ